MQQGVCLRKHAACGDPTPPPHLQRLGWRCLEFRRRLGLRLLLLHDCGSERDRRRALRRRERRGLVRAPAERPFPLIGRPSTPFCFHIPCLVVACHCKPRYDRKAHSMMCASCCRALFCMWRHANAPSRRQRSGVAEQRRLFLLPLPHITALHTEESHRHGAALLQLWQCGVGRRHAADTRQTAAAARRKRSAVSVPRCSALAAST